MPNGSATTAARPTGMSKGFGHHPPASCLDHGGGLRLTKLADVPALTGTHGPGAYLPPGGRFPRFMLLAFNKLCSGQFYPPTEASGCRPNAPLTSLARFSEDEQGWMMNQDMAGSRAERRYEVRPVAWVESPLTDRAQAPRQGFLGAPPAWLVVEPDVADGIRDLRPGDQVIVLTWLDRARRDELATVPGDNPASPPLGVFSTRSPNRPNPIGLHRTQVLAVEGLRIQVSELEALDGTPVIDIKPVIDRVAER